jgi:hypothetical protein
MTVQRPSKWSLVSASLTRFRNANAGGEEIFVVGCSDRDLAAAEADPSGFVGVGYVPQHRLFSFGDVFLQPTGYGEGFPHSLADAICSGMRIFIEDSEYRRLGLAALGCRRSPLQGGWSEVLYREGAQGAVGVDQVTERYFSFFTSDDGAESQLVEARES